MHLLLCLGTSLGCVALQSGDDLIAAHALEASALGTGGNAGAPEKSTKKALPLLCFAQTELLAEAAILGSDMEQIGLPLVAASRLTKKACALLDFAAAAACSCCRGLTAAGEFKVTKNEPVEAVEAATTGAGDASRTWFGCKGLALA